MKVFYRKRRNKEKISELEIFKNNGNQIVTINTIFSFLH